MLARAIVFQQLSTKAARTIYGRLEEAAGGKLTPEAIQNLSVGEMRRAGLSRQKLGYIRDLAEHAISGKVDFAKLPSMSDEEVIASLTDIKGVGVWTAHMFLLFSLRRPNVLPVGDLGVRMAIQRAYKKRKMPTPKQVEQIAKSWHPYCSFAAWYLWRSLELPKDENSTTEARRHGEKRKRKVRSAKRHRSKVFIAAKIHRPELVRHERQSHSTSSVSLWLRGRLSVLIESNKMSADRKIRVLVAKPGLDGHDRGAKVIARALRDAGMEVIYTGLRQTPEMIVNSALQEDVDVIGLSILSGAHNAIVPRVSDLLKQNKMEDVLFLIGGIIPEQDFDFLKKAGVSAIFNPGTPMDDIAAFIRKNVKPRGLITA